MFLHKRSITTTLLLGTCCLLGMGAAMAQTFPERSTPIKIVVAYPPGGSSDFAARTIAAQMAKNMQHSVLVENRPGGTTIVAGTHVANAKPDGYTLLMASGVTQASLPGLHRKLPFDVEKSFSPISNFVDSPLVFSTHPSLPPTTLKEFIDYAKARPGEISYGSAGIGNTLHLATEAFQDAAGVQMREVPFKGASQSIISLLAGDIDVMFDLVQTPLPHIRRGTLKPLAVTSAKRLDALPDVPTVMEAGVPGFTFVTSLGLLAPADTPADVIQALHREIVKATQDPDVQQKFAAQSMIVRSSDSPAAYETELKSVIDQVDRILKRAGVSPQ
ncbi:MAG: tripartite tricarboxylate transporter substrate binding protein [Burkholderiaceae bacterium]